MHRRGGESAPVQFGHIGKQTGGGGLLDGQPGCAGVLLLNSSSDTFATHRPQSPIDLFGGWTPTQSNADMNAFLQKNSQ